jgi:hypothetical protein
MHEARNKAKSHIWPPSRFIGAHGTVFKAVERVETGTDKSFPYNT